MIAFKSFYDFSIRVGLILDCDEVSELGLMSDSIIGYFWPDSMAPVLAFCEKNPEFHIVSFLGEGIFVNRYQVGDGLYSLANGDADPHIWCDRREFYHSLFFSIKLKR